jgi:hypothetical protein
MILTWHVPSVGVVGLVKEPAMTKVFPVLGSIEEQIKTLKQQIAELEQQKKCYDKMILARIKLINKLTPKSYKHVRK